MKKTYLVLSIFALCVALPLGVVFFGLVNVAASRPENPLVEWLLSTTMKRSVSARAPDVDPPDLTDEDRIRKGLSHYAGMCVDCHGAPGVEPSGFIRGLNPPAPILVEEVDGWSAAELFWITKHGVKMTGMPAFGQAHSDEEIWAIVAFLQHMPTLSPQEYARELQAAGPHSHGPGSETHDTGDEHGIAHDDHGDSLTQADGDHEHGDSDDHGAHDEANTQDEEDREPVAQEEGHADHEHPHEEL